MLVFELLFQKCTIKQILQFKMLPKSRKLQVENDSQLVHLEEFLRSCQESGHQVFKLQQKKPTSFNQRKALRKDNQSPKKKKEQRTSIAQRILPQQRCILESNCDRIKQNSNYSCLNMTSPIELALNDSTSQNKVQSKVIYDPVIQYYQQTTVLRDIIKKYKIKSIVSNFVKKIKRVSVLRDPVQYKQFKKQNRGFFYRYEGWQIPQMLQNIMSLISILQIVIFSTFYSLSLVYNELQNSEELIYVESFTCLFLVLQILVNLVTVKYSSGKKMKIFMQIWNLYFEGYLIIDCLGVITLFISILSRVNVIEYFKLILLLKIPQCMKKMEIIEVNFIKNLYNEQYWSLIKIFLFNFSFAHIISILLTGMANLSPQNNWMTIRNIQMAPWYQKYSWAYYWANTIMLTVGFGDFTASNYKQAICLVFIQTFSCMAFAYNINCIGGIIQQILAKDAQRSQKSKIFTKLQNKNKLSEELSWKINNYIQQTAQLRKNFNYQQQKQFITNLPVEMKKEYLKQSNKNIFESIQFFRSFINKTLYNLAQKIEMRVSHPEEIIQHIDDDYNLIILKNGSLGMVYKRADFQLKQPIMDRIVVKEKQNPSLVNLDFIVRKRPFYQIKSMEYAIFYYLTYDKFIDILRQTEMDYEFFCTLRDRIKNIPDQFQVLDCGLCDGKHLKALCPKLHYIPFHQTVIHRHLHQEKVSRNHRIKLNAKGRIKKHSNAFYVYKKSIQNLQKLGNIISRRRNRQGQSTSGYISQCSDVHQTQQTLVEKSIHVIHSQLREFTHEVIKEEINKLIRSDNCEDDVWMLKSDVLSDFNAYFPQHNPYNISSRYIELAELFRSENLLIAHTSVVMQQIQYSQFGRHKVHPKKKLVRSLNKKKQQ